jgi:hypothetical protein
VGKRRREFQRDKKREREMGHRGREEGEREGEMG